MQCTKSVITNSWLAVPQLPNITWGWHWVRVLARLRSYFWDQRTASPHVNMDLHFYVDLSAWMHWENRQWQYSRSWSHQCVQMQLHQRVRAPPGVGRTVHMAALWIQSNPVYFDSNSVALMGRFKHVFIRRRIFKCHSETEFWENLTWLIWGIFLVYL